MSNERIRLALFGSGRIGQVHARSMAENPDVELAVIADPFPDGAHALAASTGARVVADPEEALDEPGLDGVVIASPTPTHVDLMTRAAARGLAVLCEKPIDLDIAVVRECRDAVLAHGVPIMLGFNRRFDPAFSAIQQQVAAGAIGRLEQLIVISRDPEPAPRGYIEASGGIFRDMTIHDLDIARFFVPEIVEVTAVGSNVFSDDIAELNDFDSATVTLRGSNGEIVTIMNSRHCTFGYDQRLEAFGATGMLSAGNLTPTTVRRYDATGTEHAQAYFPFFLERYAAAYRAELDAFVASIRAGGPACSPGFDDGLLALTLAEAALHSATTGTTVSIPKT